MNNSTPVFSSTKESMIKRYIHVLGYDERMTDVIYNILIISPDTTEVFTIERYSKIRVIWSFIKAGFVVDTHGYMSPPEKPYYSTTALLSLIELVKEIEGKK